MKSKFVLLILTTIVVGSSAFIPTKKVEPIERVKPCMGKVKETITFGNLSYDVSGYTFEQKTSFVKKVMKENKIMDEGCWSCEERQAGGNCTCVVQCCYWSLELILAGQGPLCGNFQCSSVPEQAPCPW